MRFWDTSAVGALFFEERASSFFRKLLRKDDDMVVWSLTRVEFVSALERRRREGLATARYLAIQDAFDRYSGSWREVDDLLAVRGQAERFLKLHPLRAGDALQLGAAWVHVQGAPKRREFVTFDEVLAVAATAEGFSVLTD